MNTRLAAGFRTLGRLVRQLFCRHNYQRLYVSGIVTPTGPIRDAFTAKLCRKCGKAKAARSKPNAGGEGREPAGETR